MSRLHVARIFYIDNVAPADELAVIFFSKKINVESENDQIAFNLLPKKNYFNLNANVKFLHYCKIRFVYFN